MVEKTESKRVITISADIRSNIERPPLHVAVQGTADELDEMLDTLAEVSGRLRGNTTAMEITSGTIKMMQDRRLRDEAEKEKTPRPTVSPDEVRAAREAARQEGVPAAERLRLSGSEAARKAGTPQAEELHLHKEE